MGAVETSRWIIPEDGQQILPGYFLHGWRVLETPSTEEALIMMMKMICLFRRHNQTELRLRLID